MQIEPSLRASDADREQVAERLRHATAEGRLNADELEGRLHALFAARTYGELGALVADLPAAGRAPRPQRRHVGRWAAAAGAVVFMVAVFGALAIARVHGAVGVAGLGGGARLPTPLRGVRVFRPPLPDPLHGVIVVASVLVLVTVLLAGGALLWVLTHSRGGVGRLNGPTSRVD